MNVNEYWVQADDTDVFQGLVRQPETNCVSSNTPQVHTQEDGTDHCECEPSVTNGNNSCTVSESTSDLATASHRLTRLGRENGFTVHDVPGDGYSIPT